MTAPAAANPAARPPRIDAIVLNWHGFADTCAAVDSLLAQDWPELVVHVVDNASAGGEADRLAARYGDRIRLRRHDRNLGFTGGHNGLLRELLAEGRAEFFALLNNDAIAAPGWLAALAAAAAADPRIGVCASRMVFKAQPDRIENAGVVLLRGGEALPRGRGRPAHEFLAPADLLAACGGAMLLRAAALRDGGLFRDEFFLNFEDVDLTLRLVARGWRCRYAPDAVVHHGLSQSIDKVRDEAFAVRSIRNMGFAYLANMPAAVLLAHLPWLLLGWLVAPLACALLGQFGYARLLLRGRLQTLRELPALRAARRALAPHRRASPWWLLAHHGSTLAAYGRFVRDVVIRRRRAAFR